jgi:hypothetical protein
LRPLDGEAAAIDLRVEREMRAAITEYRAMESGQGNRKGMTFFRIVIAAAEMWSKRYSATRRPIARKLTALVLDAQSAPNLIAAFVAACEAEIATHEAAKAAAANATEA